MLSLPIYRRGDVYYFHTRIAGKQFKRSLNTNDKTLAILRASKYLEAVEMAIRRYEIDLGKGILKANDPDDHQRMMEALSVLQAKTSEPLQKPPAVPPSTKSGLRLGFQRGAASLAHRNPKRSEVGSHSE